MLTEAGRAFHRDAISAVEPEFGAMLQEIPYEELAEALPLLKRVRAYMDSARD